MIWLRFLFAIDTGEMHEPHSNGFHDNSTISINWNYTIYAPIIWPLMRLLIRWLFMEKQIFQYQFWVNYASVDRTFNEWRINSQQLMANIYNQSISSNLVLIEISIFILYSHNGMRPNVVNIHLNNSYLEIQLEKFLHIPANELRWNV